MPAGFNVFSSDFGDQVDQTQDSVRINGLLQVQTILDAVVKSGQTPHLIDILQAAIDTQTVVDGILVEEPYVSFNRDSEIHREVIAALAQTASHDLATDPVQVTAAQAMLELLQAK